METVRRAETSDIPVLVEFAAALNDELAPMRGGAIWHARDARDAHGDLRAEFASLLADPNVRVVLGLLEDTPVAFATVVFETLRTGDVLARVTELFVLEEARAVGVGEAVADAVVAEAVRGCIGVDALALPGNRAAKNFFERQGFTARLITMHKPLA